MHDFPLPEISAEAKPEFADGAACAAWLAELPLVNVAPSQARLLDQIQQLNRYGMPPAARLDVLEAMREPVYFVQAEQIKKLANKPLPLTQVERGIFVQVVQLWQELLIGYQRCLKSAIEGAIEDRTALICHRALDCVAASMYDHCRTYHAFPESYWLTLHQLYRLAEDAGKVASPVGEPLTKRDVCCTEVYVRVIFLMLANPNEQQQKPLTQIRFWLERWAQHVPIRREPPSDKSLMPLMLDFSVAAGAYRGADIEGRSPTHWLDTGELARVLKILVVRLRKGETPASLGLGEGCAMPDVEQLLVQLFRSWCEGRNVRAQARQRVNAKAKVCSTLGSIHFHISGGKPFRQPGHVTELTRREHDEIATFGRTSTRHVDAFIEGGGYATEEWQLHEESVSGLRLFRPAAASGGRYAITQLLAVRPDGARNFLLGVVRWLMTEHDDGLNLGARVIIGEAKAVAVRSAGINAQKEKYVPALYCPPVAALTSPAFLILPPGWFRPKRVVEIYADEAEQVMLSGVIERGSDFERVAIEPPP
jgi:hypothetical protein